MLVEKIKYVRIVHDRSRLPCVDSFMRIISFSTTLIILVKVVLQKAPSYFKFNTKYEECVIDFNNKADK